MKVYVAGSSAHIPEVRIVMTALQQLGHQITLDWTKSFDSTPCQEPRFYARQDAAAIRACDALVFLDTPTISPGAWWELGYAQAIGRQILCLCSDRTVCVKKIFLFMPGVVRHYSLQELLNCKEVACA